MLLQLLTPTGGRPVAWALAERWALAQRYAGPVRWIVVDDGPEPQPIRMRRPGWQIEVIRPHPRWSPGQNTQARNMLAGLAACDPALPVVCWEDDDYYAPSWLETITAELGRAELVGSARIIYYNVTTRHWRQMNNTGHAAMSCTALRGGALATLRAVATTRDSYLDDHLWHTHPSRYLFEASEVISIKGLPGRPGIGRGHHPRFGGVTDHDGSVLRRLLGADAAVYQAGTAWEAA